MTLVERINELVTAIGADIKALYASGIPNLSDYVKKKSVFGLAVLDNAKFVKYETILASVGDTKLLTVPAGKRIFFNTIRISNINHSSNGTYYIYVKKAGQGYRLMANGSALVNAVSNTNIAYIAEEGEEIWVNAAHAVNNQLSYFLTGIMFDDTSNLKPIKKFGMTAGYGLNEMYQCPANKSAVMLNPSTIGDSGLSSQVYMFSQNTGSSSRQLVAYILPDGVTPSPVKYANSGAYTNSTTNGKISIFFYGAAFNAGDKFILEIGGLNSGGDATQMAYFNIVEIDN